jgi:toxin-antitoxin system PIN domain toxin
MPRFSKLFLFPDVNVWIALTYQGHVHHVSAKRWFQALNDDARLCFCRFTQLSLLRLLTTEALMGNEVMGQVEAWQTYDRWLADPRVLFLEEPDGLEPIFRSMSGLLRPAPKDWADAYLAAFATACGMSLVTFDQAFRRRAQRLVLLRS